MSVIPDRACCCSAKPVANAVMPATKNRAHSVDLWLCGHHWRVSRVALAEAGAEVYDVAALAAEEEAHREGAPV
ncbi:MAG TPA: hypothetical protein VIV12_05205 [Streptosporangiaceae bacterium]